MYFAKFRFLALPKPVLVTIALALGFVVLGTIAAISANTTPATVQARQASSFSDTDQLDITYLTQRCVDRQHRFSTGACFNLDQFEEKPDGQTVEYKHSPKDGQMLSNCTGDYENLNPNYYTYIVREDGVPDMITGETSAKGVCFIRVSLREMTLPESEEGQ